MPHLEVGSPRWWLERLEAELLARQPHMDLMDRYYSGDHPLPFLTKAHDAKMRNEFRRLLEDSRTNFMRLVVDATEERMRVEGFRLSAETDPVADQESWRIWQANQMDAESQAAFVAALIKGVAYLSVWEAAEGEEFPRIAVEDASQTIVAYAAGSNFRQRVAALKTWVDDRMGVRRANIYLPDAIHKFIAQGTTAMRQAGSLMSAAASSATDSSAWREMEEERVPNSLGIVPIIPLRNRPRILLEGESELGDVFRTQNSINGFLFLLALAGYFGAHRQRWATGIALMENEKGEPVEPFDSAIDRLWVAQADEEGTEPKFGEFEATSLDGYIKAIEQKVQHIAVTSRTPRHYLMPEGQSPSGDAIRSAEAGLTAKVRRKFRPFGEGLEEALRLARRFAGEEAAPVDSEIVWADPETRTQAETTDAVIKQWSAGLIDSSTALEELGYTQTQIRRITAARAQDVLLSALAQQAPEDVEDVAEQEEEVAAA